jgi:hypothetical protein
VLGCWGAGWEAFKLLSLQQQATCVPTGKSATHASPQHTAAPHLLQALPAACLVVAAGARGALAVAAALLAAHQGALGAHTKAVEEHSGKPSSAGGACGDKALVAHRRAALAPLAQRVGAGLRLQGADGARGKGRKGAQQWELHRSCRWPVAAACPAWQRSERAGKMDLQFATVLTPLLSYSPL